MRNASMATTVGASGDEQPERMDGLLLEAALEDGKSGRVRGVGNDGEPAPAGDRARK